MACDVVERGTENEERKTLFKDSSSILYCAESFALMPFSLFLYFFLVVFLLFHICRPVDPHTCTVFVCRWPLYAVPNLYAKNPSNNTWKIVANILGYHSPPSWLIFTFLAFSDRSHSLNRSRCRTHTHTVCCPTLLSSLTYMRQCVCALQMPVSTHYPPECYIKLLVPSFSEHSALPFVLSLSGRTVTTAASIWQNCYVLAMWSHK